MSAQASAGAPPSGAADGAAGPVRLSRERGEVAVLRLARPPVNALDLRTLEELTDAFETVAADARAIVITGEGSCFSAGIDLKWAARADQRERERGAAAINRMVSVVYSLPVPCVAAINGHAHGGGLVLALACDVRLATDAATSLALDEAAAGVPFPEGALAVVRAELDPSVARELSLTARSFDTARALALRVVDERVAATSLLDRAVGVAGELAAHPAYAEVKAQLRAPVAARLAAIAGARRDEVPERPAG